MTQYQDFADLFSFYSRATIQSVKENGELVAGYSQTRQERLLLRDIIRLFQCFIERVKGREVNDSNQIDLNSVCQQTLSLILKDYEDAPECLKEPCCLQFSAVVLEKLKVGDQRVYENSHKTQHSQHPFSHRSSYPHCI